MWLLLHLRDTVPDKPRHQDSGRWICYQNLKTATQLDKKRLKMRCIETLASEAHAQHKVRSIYSKTSKQTDNLQQYDDSVYQQ